METTIKKTRNSKPKVDLTDRVFGYLTAKEYIKGGKWKCQCKCGKETIVDTRNLNSGHTTSCGCRNKEVNSNNNTVNMIGFETATFKVLQREGSDAQGIAMWRCLCKNCNNEFVARGAHLRNGDIKSCGCINSHNEQVIAALLSENNIEFCQQYTFPDLLGLNGGHLRFDFAVFKDKQLHHLIEYNGKQHYEKVDGAWGEGFEQLQKHDELKVQYCKDHNIELRVIKYDQEYSLEDLI